MKNLNYRMLVAVLFLVIGSMSVSAQIGRGGTCLNSGTCIVEDGTCPLTLTDEQQAIIDELRADFQAEMDLLRTAMQSATTFADKLLIRQDMIDLRNAHIAEVQALLEEWGLK